MGLELRESQIPAVEDLRIGKLQGPGRMLWRVQMGQLVGLLMGYWKLGNGRGMEDQAFSLRAFDELVGEIMEANRRRSYRLLKDTTPLQRGIIRHLILIIDLSSAMTEKDLRPTRYLLTLRYVVEFVHEFFEQNPISQLGIIGMRDGLAVRVSDMSGNPNDHVGKLQALREQEPKGSPSLQNALDMARAALL